MRMGGEDCQEAQSVLSNPLKPPVHKDRWSGRQVGFGILSPRFKMAFAQASYLFLQLVVVQNWTSMKH